jgi:hypothetical protein
MTEANSKPTPKQGDKAFEFDYVFNRHKENADAIDDVAGRGVRGGWLVYLRSGPMIEVELVVAQMGIEPELDSNTWREIKR